MARWLRACQIYFLACLLSACASGDNYAPVTDIATIQPIPASGKQKAVSGDSLYAIAWRYGLDYRDLARRNHITSPYKIYSVRHIYLKGRAPDMKARRVATKPVHVVSPPIHLPNVAESKPAFSNKWAWPARGSIVMGFAGLNKGINIAGAYGAPVRAANSGKVVYSGNGLRAYGNLIIIKHNDVYMSAYAHNSRVLVKEGDTVKKNQKISEMGNTGTNKVMLHFEIRKNGKPVNPINMLKS